jgi:acetate kinase
MTDGALDGSARRAAIARATGCAPAGGSRVLGVGHRVVHGGPRFAPTIVTPGVLTNCGGLFRRAAA